MRAAVESFNARGKLRGRLYGEAACVFVILFFFETPLSFACFTLSKYERGCSRGRGAHGQWKQMNFRGDY